MTSKTLINNLINPNYTDDLNLESDNIQMAVSKLVTNSTFYKEKKSAMKSSRTYYADQPLSINVGVKYEPYIFEKNLKKNHRSKLEEEVDKIKQYTIIMQRTDQEAKVKDKNFEKMRQLDMQSLEKRIPKLAILHKIQAFHRKKFPQFDINKCLKRKKQSEDMSRGEYIETEEKKITQQVARKTLLQRQQDIIKRCLSPKTREALGVHVEIKNDNFGDETNTNQTYYQTRGAHSFGFSTRTPSNRHQTPCCSSFHDDNVLKNYVNKSFNSQRAHSSSENRRKMSLVNQSLDMNIQSYGQTYQENFVKQDNQKRQSFLFATNHNNNLQGTDVNSIQQNTLNPYNSNTMQSTSYQGQNKRKFSSAMCSPQIQTPQQNSPEREKKQRENSPMRFLFKKYENVVNESYDDFRIEMKNIADVYLQNKQPRKNSNSGTQNTETNQSRKLSVQQVLAGNAQNVNSEQLSSQQILQQNANQRKQSIQLSSNNQQITRQNVQFSSPMRQQQQSNTADNSEQQYAESSGIPAQNQSNPRKSKFIEKNQGVQQLNKTLNEFEKENLKIKRKVNSFQKNIEQNDKKMDDALEMRRKCDSYNVSDFLMKVQQKKMADQEEKQKQEAKKKKFSKVERNNQAQ